jgi:hypothetical protein
MATRLKQQGIFNHPMLKTITEAAISGQTSTQIAKWVLPQVSRSAIERYITTRVKPAKANAALLLSVVPLPPVMGTHKHLPETKGVTSEEWEKTEDCSPVDPIRTDQVEQVNKLAKTALLATPVLQIRENRIAAKEDRHRRFQMIVEGRARAHADVEGGASGFLTQDYRGENVVYKFDSALATAFEENEKAIAIESGQWQENAAGNVAIQIICPVSPGGDLTPRVVYSAFGAGSAIDAAPGSVEEVEDPIVEIGLLQAPS